MVGSGQYPSLMVDIDPTRGWHLAADLSNTTVALAASELEAALGRPGEDGIEIALSHAGGAGDGFRRRAQPARVELHGDSPRGLLFGVYRTLEELGLVLAVAGAEGRRGAGRSARGA